MSKIVYFTRHGESEANIKGVMAGSNDNSSLTELGKQQAKDTARNLKGIDFDLIVSSPMSRTLDTTKIIMNELGIEKEIIIKPEFIERDVGKFAGKPIEAYFAFLAEGGETGESATDMQSRVRAGLHWLKEQDFENTLVITHNGTIRMIRTVLERLPAKDFTNIPKLRNGEYRKVDLGLVTL
jgi:broad specificity phosphatase PhoE